MHSFSYLEPVCCSMSSSNCCFLTCIQISQEAGQVVWYSHLFQNFPQLIVIHTLKGFGIVNRLWFIILFILILMWSWILPVQAPPRWLPCSGLWQPPSGWCDMDAATPHSGSPGLAACACSLPLDSDAPQAASLRQCFPCTAPSSGFRVELFRR